MKIVLYIESSNTDLLTKVEDRLKIRTDLALLIAKIALRDGGKADVRFTAQHWFSTEVLLMENIDMRLVKFLNNRQGTCRLIILEAAELASVTSRLPKKEQNPYFYSL